MKDEQNLPFKEWIELFHLLSYYNREWRVIYSCTCNIYLQIARKYSAIQLIISFRMSSICAKFINSICVYMFGFASLITYSLRSCLVYYRMCPECLMLRKFSYCWTILNFQSIYMRKFNSSIHWCNLRHVNFAKQGSKLQNGTDFLHLNFYHKANFDSLINDTRKQNLMYWSMHRRGCQILYGWKHFCMQLISFQKPSCTEFRSSEL